jgi:hypothetical protein
VTLAPLHELREQTDRTADAVAATLQACAALDACPPWRLRKLLRLRREMLAARAVMERESRKLAAMGGAPSPYR